MYGLSLSRPPIPKKNHTHTTLSPLGVIRGIGRISIENCVCAVCVQCVKWMDVRAYVRDGTALVCHYHNFVSSCWLVTSVVPNNNNNHASLVFQWWVCVCSHSHNWCIPHIYIFIYGPFHIYPSKSDLYICVYIFGVGNTMFCRCGAPTLGNYDACDGPRWTMHRRKIAFFPPPPFQYRYDSAKYRTAWSPSCCYIHTLVILVHPLSHIIYIYTFIYQSR